MIMTSLIISFVLMMLVFALGQVGTGLNQQGIVDSVLFHQNVNTSGVQAQLGPVDDADAEVHWFRKIAALFGISSMINATVVGGDAYSVVMNTWKRSRVWELPWHVAINSAGKPTHWLDVILGLIPDADFTIEGLQTSGQDNKDMAVLLHILYGGVPTPPGPGLGEQTIESFQAPVNVIADEWTEIATINDLDPETTYALLSGIIISDNAIAVRFKADSFQGATPAWLGTSIPQVGMERLNDAARFAMYFTGKESLTIEAFCGAEEQPYGYAILAPVGGQRPGRATVTAPRGATGAINLPNVMKLLG